MARAIDELIELVRTYPRENQGQLEVDPHEMAMFKAYYSSLMYKVGGHVFVTVFSP